MSEALLSIPYVQIVGPTHFLVVAVLTQHFGLTAAVFGFIAALPGWCAMLQFFATPRMAARLGPRRMSFTVQGIDLAIWFSVLVALPWIGNAGTTAATIFFVVVFITSQGVRAINRVAHPTWTCQWLPARVRGSFFGNRNGWSTTVLIIFAVAIVPLLQRTDSWTAYQLFLAVAVLMKVASFYLQTQIRTPAGAESASECHGVPAATPTLSGLRDWRGFLEAGRPFIIFTGLLALAGLFRSITGPFRTLYLLQEVGFSPAMLAQFSLVELIVTAAAFPLWAYVGRKTSFAFVIRLTLFGFVAEALAWGLLPGSAVTGFYLLKAGGAFVVTGFNLALITQQMNLLPKANGATYFSLAIAVDAVCGGLTPMLFGLALDEAGRNAVMYRLGFLVTASGVMVAALLFWLQSRNSKSPRPRPPTELLAARETQVSLAR